MTQKETISQQKILELESRVSNKSEQHQKEMDEMRLKIENER